MEKKNGRTDLSEEQLTKISGGEGVNVADYSEEALARIFDLYLEMYGETGALPYLAGWGVTTGDYYLMLRSQYWVNTPYCDASMGWRLAHLVYQRNH